MSKKGKIKGDGSLACPRCGCTALAGNKKGFGLAKGALGIAALGPVGVLAAGIGKNKVKVKCMHCGKSWTV